MKPIRLALAAWSAAALVTAATAQPAVTPDAPVMNLDELGVYAVGYAYRGQPEQQFPVGWSDFFEERTGVACEPFGTQNGERAFLLHSPLAQWHRHHLPAIRLQSANDGHTHPAARCNRDAL